MDLMSNIYHYDEKNVWTFIRVENDSLVTGYRQTHGWARTKLVYFAMKFSKPIESYGHKKYDKSITMAFTGNLTNMKISLRWPGKTSGPSSISILKKEKYQDKICPFKC